jgi:hypothetical protein
VDGHKYTGRLKEVHPPYRHGYGDFVPEILDVRRIIQQDQRGDRRGQ